MESSFHKIMEWYRLVVDEKADPRTESWPLVYSPWTPIGTAMLYVLFCSNVRQYMAKMPTYHIRPALVTYNMMMVALSCYMTYEFFVTAYKSGYNLLCQAVDFAPNPLPIRMASVCWVYYASKYVELLETVMFALRKKYSQITFLHVYHHTSMIFIWWMGVKYCAGGQTFLFGGINSFVHAVMYTYYGLSAIGPHMQKYLWWKKYITVLQLSQFVILFFYCIRSLTTGCGYAAWMCTLNIGYAISLLLLFLNFYFQAYIYRKSATKKQKGTAVTNGVAKNGAVANGNLKHD
uniref:Elongation of very long chain fatty acids protein n=1 Tax=Phallusia mammillata TaxID=59560 RepID=A0A6F9DBA6_9ASCI|nr:elongation of very long chain fatty acids protein 4-like [Phallusia mammillata]